MKRKSAARTARALALGALFSSAAADDARGQWLLYADAGAYGDSNVSRASGADVRGDAALALVASVGRFFAPTGSDGVTLSLDANAEGYDRYRGLDHVALGGTVAWRHKFGLGYRAPWMRLSAAALHDDYRSDIRDGSVAYLRAEAGTRISEALDASGGVIADRRRAANDEPEVPGISGRVFDLAGTSVFLRAGYAVSDRLLLGIRTEVRRGDVVSASQRNRDVFLASSAIAEDPTFGDEIYDYRLRGTTWSALASASWALNDRASLNLSCGGERTRAAGGLDYRGRTVRVSFAYGY